MAFLRDRLDEDEATAKAATPGPWVVGRTVDEDGEHYGSHVASVGAEKRMLLTMTTGYIRSRHVPTAEHIVHYDPVRVLREVEAKQAILTEIESELADDPTVVMPQDRLRILAAVYRDHPDYDPKWE